MPANSSGNVDRNLHKAADPSDRSSETPKVGLRGAAGGVYIGPVLSIASGGKESSVSHAVTSSGGGAEDSTGYRKSDTYAADGDSGLGTASSSARPTGRTMYRGDGVQGGSTPGRPIASGTDHVLSGGGYATGTFDKRSTIAGEGGIALGHAGRGSRVLGETVTTSGKKNVRANFLPRPTTQAGADPASGVVQVVGGVAAGRIDCDLHADDITGGANGRSGVEVVAFTRNTDTDTDLAFAKKADFDSTTSGGAITGLTAGTYAVYVRFKAGVETADTQPQTHVGPYSARTTATVT